MGLLDTLLGRTKPVRANLDALFALPSAAVTLQTAAGLVLSGSAGVCWKPPAGQSAQDVQREIAELLDIPDDADVAGDRPVGGEVVRRRRRRWRSPRGDGGSAARRAARGRSPRPRTPTATAGCCSTIPTSTDLVTRVHLVNTTLEDNGWGPQLLCSVFGWCRGPTPAPTPEALYLVYLYKRGTFYPFAPDGKEHRDNELELRIRAVVGADLPIETDLSRWFPLWDLPVR